MSDGPRSWTVGSAAQLRALGRTLSHQLVSPGRRGAVVLVDGDLGAGKTTLVQGILKALGVRDTVKSPSFDLVHRYRLGDGTTALHVDLYRLDPPPPPDALDADDDAALVLVEWGGPWRAWYPERWEIRLDILPDGGRRVTVEHVGSGGPPGGERGHGGLEQG
jgi:tRNA threonylcarbamoyladenosine biosynthesis protein TsaE